MGAEGGLVTSLEDLLEGGTLSRLIHEGAIKDTLTKLIEQSGRGILEPRSDGCSLLHRFTLVGCYEAVKVLWESGAKPSVLQSDDSTLLHSAVRTTDVLQDEQRSKILALFLSDKRRSIPINQVNSKGWTTLKLAARKGLERCVEILIDKGADPNIADLEGYVPLHNAIGSHAIVKLLVSQPHNIDAQTQKGETPLYLGVERGNKDCTLTLLEHKANPNILNKEGISPLFVAARGGNIDLVRVLLRYGANVNTVGGSQRIAPLHWAAHKEHCDIALLLIEFGADIQLKDKEGRTPLSLAAPGLASKMLAYAKQRDPRLAVTSLHAQPTISSEEKAVTACCSGNVQALQSLLNAGVDVNYSNEGTTWTLLHMGSYCGQVGVVALLLNNGANWQLRDKDGDTVLHFACMKLVPQGNHDATLQFLLSSTPAVNLINSQNSRGDTPLLVAIRCQFISRAKILLHHKADPMIKNNKKELPLHRACSTNDNIGIVMELCEFVLDLDTQDGDGWTPLMYATRSQSSYIVHYLLQRGVDPNLQQSAGFTALHLAAQENLPEVCQLLLKFKANPNIVGGPQELTPLHIASHKSYKEVCRILVENGADFTLTDKNGDTPLTFTDDVAIKQIIENTHCLVRDRSNSHPNSPASMFGFCKCKSLEEDEQDKICSLNETIISKDKCMEKLLEKLKCLCNENELLQSRIKAHEDEISFKMSQVQVEPDEEGTSHRRPWWLIGEHELKISDEQLNGSTEMFQRFYNVYKGTYRTMDVAVKKIISNENWEDCTRKTFMREVEQISRLQCPHIVQFMGASLVETVGLYCLVFELLPMDLHIFLHVKKVEATHLDKMLIVNDIASGMAYLHSIPVLHKNLIPRNILISEKLKAKISDFGFYETKVQTNFYANIRKCCLKLDTQLRPLYKAPEVIEKHEFTTASDMYSFGMIMYEMATNNKPYYDKDPCSNAMVWCMRVIMGMRPEVPTNLQKGCQEMIVRCWNPNPSLRPSFKEFLMHCNKQIKEESVATDAEHNTESNDQ